MIPIDFGSVLLKAREFREKYRMENVDRPMSRPVCLKLAELLERNRELLEAISDVRFEDKLATLGQEWGAELTAAITTLLEQLDKVQEASTFPELQVARWLKMGFLTGEYREDGSIQEAISPDKFFDRSVRELRKILERLNLAAKIELKIAAIAKETAKSEDAVLFERVLALSRISKEILPFAFSQLRFPRRSPTLSQELAEFLTDVFTLAGLEVPKVLLLDEALQFCHSRKKGKPGRKPKTRR